jgi:hypothetical protein
MEICGLAAVLPALRFDPITEGLKMGEEPVDYQKAIVTLRQMAEPKAQVVGPEGA